MNTPAKLSRAAAGAIGGAVKSPAKLEALARLHEGRRGVRIQTPGCNLPALMADTAAVIASKKISKRRLAEKIGVSDKTVRRWLLDIDHPDAATCRKIRAAINAAKTGGAAE